MVRYDSGDTSGSESGDEGAATNSTSAASNNLHPPGSWRAWKERGKQAYLNGDYASALQNYSQALQRQNNIHLLNNEISNNLNSSLLPSTLDKQILLSNMVACRLKIGGAPQAEAAIANAQKCISIDSKWAKGHMRLAEAHLALSKATTHSEKQQSSSQKACEALQIVLTLDPTNQTAHNLLTKEMRYNALHNNNASTSEGNSSSRQSQAPEPSAPPEYMDESSRANEHEQQENEPEVIDIEDDENYVFAPTWKDRVAFWNQRVRAWYTGLREDDKSLVKLAVLFVVLYVAFGGRFGLEYLGKSKTSSRRRSNSVYDDFYQSRSGNNRQTYDSNYGRRTTTSSSYGSNGNGSSRSSYNSNYSTSSYGNYWGTGSGLSNGQYMLLVLILSFGSQRFFGIGPMQLLFWLNMLNGRRNRFFAPRYGFGGGGWGGHGMYYNPRAGHYRHRPGGMWWR